MFFLLFTFLSLSSGYLSIETVVPQFIRLATFYNMFPAYLVPPQEFVANVQGNHAPHYTLVSL